MVPAKAEAVYPAGLPGRDRSSGERWTFAFGHRGSRIPVFGKSWLPHRTVTLAGINLASASLHHLHRHQQWRERYVAIRHSLRYETLVTANRLITAVAAAWTIPVATTLIALITHENCADEPCCTCKNASLAVIFLGIPGSPFAICFFQVAVFLESRRHRRHIRAHQVLEAATMEILKQKQASRTTAMIVGALLLSYAPTIVCNVVTLAARLPIDVEFGAFFITDVFICANSLIVNPIIYCMRMQDLKRALRENQKPRASSPSSSGNPFSGIRQRISEATRLCPEAESSSRRLTERPRVARVLTRSFIKSLKDLLGYGKKTNGHRWSTIICHAKINEHQSTTLEDLDIHLE